MPQHLHLKLWPSGVLSIDFEEHQKEMPECIHTAFPSAKKHNALTDALILKWFDTHGPGSAWNIAIHLGGETAGYTEGWVVHRFCYIVDQIYASDMPGEELISEPPFIEGERSTVRPPTPEKKAGRTNWTRASDERLKLWVSVNGHKWRALARHMGGVTMGFSDDCVRNRYQRIMGQHTTNSKCIRGAPVGGLRWSKEEDLIIEKLYNSGRGSMWTAIAASLSSDRTPAAVRLRAQRLGLLENKSF